MRTIQFFMVLSLVGGTQLSASQTATSAGDTATVQNAAQDADKKNGSVTDTKVEKKMAEQQITDGTTKKDEKPAETIGKEAVPAGDTQMATEQKNETVEVKKTAEEKKVEAPSAQPEAKPAEPTVSGLAAPVLPEVVAKKTIVETIKEVPVELVEKKTMPTVAAPEINKPKEAKLPEVPKMDETPAPAEPTEPVEIVNIDTIDLQEYKGNWLLKRQWWERAEATYEKIKQQVEQLFEIRMVFYDQRTELDRTTFAPFYQRIGINAGQIQEILADLTAKVEEHEKSTEHSKESTEEKDEERRFVLLLTKEKVALQQLQTEVALVASYDRALNEALIKLREQINSARSYEMKAWNNFKEIARELSDKKAYELFYQMKGFSSNIANITNYIKNPFAKYYRELVEKVKAQVAMVERSAETLKEKGIDLKKEEDKFQEQLRGGKKECPTPVEDQEQPEEEKGILYWVTWPFIKAWEGISSLFSGAYAGARSLFVSPQEVDEE